MKVTWLTQAGLLFENERIRVLVDPYFSDSVGERCPDKHRRMPVAAHCFDLAPDVLLITHDHQDHLDEQTLVRLLDTEKKMTILAPDGCFQKLVAMGHGHNVVMFSPHSVWSEKNVTFYGVAAAHSDKNAMGFILDDGNRTYYISGDTIYHYDVIDDVLDLVEDGVDVAFLPINGVGCNMNMRDAADFAYELGAKRAVPIHYGLFDDLDPAGFDFEDALILLPYQPTEL